MTAIDLSGKVAIVTGGGRGMGRAMAMALARSGASVTVTAAAQSSELKAAVKEIGKARGEERVYGMIADVRDEDACRRTIEVTLKRFGDLHVLVNNAGRGHKFIHDANPGAPMDFWNADAAAWKLIVDTNVNGPFHMAKAATPHFLEQGFGRIVNIGVTESSMRKGRNSPYGSSKAAMEAQTLIWAQDLEQTGKNVTCNSLSPGGATLTGMIYEDYGDRKLNDPAIMGPPIAWLASELSDGFNGLRFIAKDWDDALDPTEAARGAIGQTALTPPSETQNRTQR